MAALLVDIGNTRLKWAILDADGLGPVRAAVHGHEWTPGRLVELWGGMAAPPRVFVASVAGTAAVEAVAQFARERWACETAVVHAAARAGGVTNGYARPEQLGVDRWLALIAAHADHAGATCVADCGTAVTVDVVDAAGRHLGGMILPGIRSMGECVLSRTRIPDCEATETERAFGRHTAEAIAAGGLNAVVGAIARALDAAHDLLGVEPRLVLAGGDAARVAAAVGRRTELRPDLVIEGLAVLARDIDA